MSKCPKCNQLISSATLSDCALGSFNGVAYSCPFCFAVLSVAIDPVALKSDMVSDVARKVSPIQEQLDRLERSVAQIGRLLEKRLGR